MAEDEYSEFDQQIIITHKLAMAYKWSYNQIWEETPYPVIKGLMKLLTLLERDQEAFLCPEEVAGYKNLVREHGTKKE